MRLAAQTFQSLGIVRHVGRHEFQCYEATRASVLRFINNTHAPAAST
jgi:hypothetical protein